jgi:hypothetical protein
MRFFLAAIFLLLMGCDPVVRYAQGRYPQCEIEKIDDITVLVSCPGEEPFEKRLRKAR